MMGQAMDTPHLFGALVVQRIEYRFPEPRIQVRFLARAMERCGAERGFRFPPMADHPRADNPSWGYWRWQVGASFRESWYTKNMKNLFLTHRQDLESLARKYHLKFVIVFGSAVIGRLKKDSDLDIAVIHEREAPLIAKDFFNLMNALTDLLGKGFSKVDLVDLAPANILLRHEITSRGKLLFGDEFGYGEYCVKSFKEYIDSKSLRDLERDLIIKRQKMLGEKLVSTTQ